VSAVAYARDERRGGRSFQRATLKDPRPVRQWMKRVDFAALDGKPQRSGTYPKDAGGFGQIHPSFRRTSIRIVAADVVVCAERDDWLSRPAIPAASEQAIAIQNVGEQIIWTDSRQHAHGLDDVPRCVRATVSPASPRQAQLGMHPALPMNDQDNFAGLGIDIDDDFVNECSDETFL
jgi:hypothetical protein